MSTCVQVMSSSTNQFKLSTHLHHSLERTLSTHNQVSTDLQKISSNCQQHRKLAESGKDNLVPCLVFHVATMLSLRAEVVQIMAHCTTPNVTVLHKGSRRP